ncbi:hypothetical protein Tco_0851497 [Tanacetum coccineum]
MTTLKFDDTHNMVAFLSKSTESDGFEQIVDFLNAHPIRSKLSMGEAHLHAQVDGKKIIIIESYVRRDLQLADEEGVDCLPNSTIFEQLTLMDEAVHKELVTVCSQGTTSGGGPRCQETIGDTIAQTSVQNVDEEMFDVNVLNGEEVFVAEQEAAANKENDEVNVVEEVVEVINTAKLITNAAQVSAVGNVVSTAGDAIIVSAATTTTATITTVDDITLAQALMEIKSTKPKEKAIVIQEQGESTTTISSQLSLQQSQDKGKGILIEPVKPMEKKNQIRFDEETALNLQEEFNEEERLEREKAKKEEESNIALIETWDDIQAKINAGHELAERMQAQEEEELAEEKKNKPPTKAPQRKIMCTYLKNMEGYKLKDLKFKEFDSIQEMFDRAFKRQKVEYDKETAELKQCLEIIPNEEEVTIDAIPLAVKSPTGVSTAQRLQRKYAKCLLLLVHNCSAEVNAASENMLEVTTASEYQVNAAS